MAVLSQTMFLTLLVDGGMVWYRHINMHAEKNWQILIWQLKGIPPNRQNFRLYGMYGTYYHACVFKVIAYLLQDDLKLSP